MQNLDKASKQALGLEKDGHVTAPYGEYRDIEASAEDSTSDSAQGIVQIQGSSLRPTEQGTQAPWIRLATALSGSKRGSVSTKVYDAGAGEVTSSMEASNVQKRKGQINTLAAKARAASHHQSVMSAMASISGTQTGQNKNALSKAKYGW